VLNEIPAIATAVADPQIIKRLPQLTASLYEKPSTFDPSSRL
jgi:hypothetical protein